MANGYGGGTNGGRGSGLPGGVPPGVEMGYAGGGNGLGGNGTASRVLERIHSVSYHATDHKLILDVETDQTVGTVKTGKVGNITIQNTGGTPTFAILAYRLWTTDLLMSGTTYHLNYLLKPGESIYVPDSPAVIADETVEQLAGTVVTDAVPTATANYMYSDSGTTIDDAGFEAADTTITVADGDYFRVNDLIQFGIDTSSTTRIEICRVTKIETNLLTLERALYGTLANDKDSENHGTSGVVDGAKVYFPYFNIYGNDYNRYTVAQTDASGRFHAMNLFGKGRAATHLMGITPGSFSAKFYLPGYQNLTNDGDVTSSTNSGLVASREYFLSVSLDGATTDAVSFTVDSSNTNFGGTNGIISKMQSMIDALYYDEAKNNYEKRATVGIVSGNVRITSGQRLSTSAVSITTNTGGDGGAHASNGDELFDTTNILGRFPADIPTAVAAKLPDDAVYDRTSYVSSPNTSAFMYDNGYGGLFGAGNGSLNMETGEINFTSYPNAEFVFSCLHTSAFSGRQSATNTAKMNSLKAIYGNVPNQKWNGELTVTRR